MQALCSLGSAALTEKYIIRYTTIDVPGDSCRTPDRKGFSYESD